MHLLKLNDAHTQDTNNMDGITEDICVRRGEKDSLSLGREGDVKN